MHVGLATDGSCCLVGKLLLNHLVSALKQQDPNLDPGVPPVLHIFVSTLLEHTNFD